MPMEQYKAQVRYDEGLAELICDQIVEGKSLRTICQGEQMPDRKSVRRWVKDRPEFALLYAEAKEDAADAFAEELIEISDEAVPTDDRGRLDAGTVQKQRLKIDTRKWIASKLKPRSYGDKLDVALSGNVAVTRTLFSPDDVIEGQLVADRQQLTPIAPQQSDDVPSK